jgi:hypothetical protein
MEIQIEGNVHLTHDGRQWILREYTGTTSINKKDEEVKDFKTLGYFTRPSQAMNTFMNLKIGRSQATNFRELQNEMKLTRELFEDSLDVYYS